MITLGNRIKLSAFTALFLLVFNSASAQWPTSYGVATISSTYCVSIDTSVPLVEFYQIDITALILQQKLMQKKCSDTFLITV